MPETKLLNIPSKVGEGPYVKAYSLIDLSDVNRIKNEVSLGNILIVRITPLAKKSVEETKIAINELCEYVRDEGGDIARLGQERIVVTPRAVKIWRKGTSSQRENIPHEERPTVIT